MKRVELLFLLIKSLGCIPLLAGILLFVQVKHGATHPHILAEARFDVAVDEYGVVQSLKHLWRFDEFFSSTVIMEFDEDGDWILNEKELAAVSKIIHASLGDFNYFQIISSNGEDVSMVAPSELLAYFEEKQLIILFETQPRDQLKMIGAVSFGVYDPTFYTAVEFRKDEHMSIEGLPTDCKRTVIRPDPDEAIAQNQDSLTDAFFTDPTDYSRIFATRLELSCPTSDE